MASPHRARKRFGQNFLHDPHVIARIIDVIDPRPGDTIVEIGPGQAALVADGIAAGMEPCVACASWSPCRR